MLSMRVRHPFPSLQSPRQAFGDATRALRRMGQLFRSDFGREWFRNEIYFRLDGSRLDGVLLSIAGNEVSTLGLLFQ